MYKYIEFKKQLGGVGFTWHNLMLSFDGLSVDLGWFYGNPFYLLQINILEARNDHNNVLTGFNLIHLQFLKFVFSISFDWS